LQTVWNIRAITNRLASAKKQSLTGMIYANTCYDDVFIEII